MFTQWPLIEADLHQWFGIDVEEDHLLRRRSYRWLMVRVAGLTRVDSAIRRHLAPPDQTKTPRRRR